MALKEVWDKLKDDEQGGRSATEGVVIKAEPSDVPVESLLVKAEAVIESSPSGLGSS